MKTAAVSRNSIASIALLPTMAQARREQGIALVIALVFLLMLTILGVAVMDTASMEGRMSGNTQEMNRAFQAAESAIENVFKDGTVYNNLIYPGNIATTTVSYPHTTVTMTITRGTDSKKMPRAKDRQNIVSAIDYGAANFDMKSVANTISNANSELLQGVAQAKPPTSN